MRVTRATATVMLLCAAALAIGSEQPAAQSRQESPQVSEQRLGRPGRALDVARSPDGLRIAWVEPRGNKWLVTVDGKEGPTYDEIGAGSLRFSPDGRRVAYAAKKGDKWFVVADGKAGPEYDGIAEGGPIFSLDGLRVAYAAKKSDKMFVVVNGVGGKEYDAIGEADPIFSLDGQRVAYAAKKRNKMFVVVDGKAGPEYDGIAGGPAFVSDGVAYPAMKDGWLLRCQQP